MNGIKDIARRIRNALGANYSGRDRAAFDPADALRLASMVLSSRGSEEATPSVVESDADPSEVEAVIACLGDDAAALRDENSESDVATNMERAAELLEGMDADMARLDWLNENHDRVGHSTGYRGAAGSWTWRDKDGWHNDAKDLRDAIDQAKAEGSAA